MTTLHLPLSPDGAGLDTTAEIPRLTAEAVRRLPPVAHVLGAGLPPSARRAVRCLAAAQRRAGMEVVTGARAAALVHLHADIGDPLAKQVLDDGSAVVQSVYSPTGRLADHPPSIPLVAATEGVARAMRGAGAESEVHVVPPVVDEEWLRQPPAPIRTGRPLVGMPAGLTRADGAEWFVSAAAAIRDARPDATFVLVGDESLLAAPRERARHLGLGRSVRFLRPVADPAAVATLMRRVDVVVCPALQDVSALPALEAMAAGRPVVASRVGALADVIVQGETGRLVPAADPSALAATVLRLLDRPAERETLVGAARQYVSHAHSADAGVGATARLYGAVAGTARTKGEGEQPALAT